VLLACDLIAAVHPEATVTVKHGHTLIVANTDVMATADFQIHRDLIVPQGRLVEKLAELAGTPPFMFAASSLSESVVGDSIAANILMLGFAWQQGRIPVTLESLEQAIKLNGRSVAANLKAFRAGRAQALAGTSSTPVPADLDSFIVRRTQALEAYWNKAYAARYVELMRTVRNAARSLKEADRFVWAAARAAYKLMAYKDEYEVARLYSNGQFRQALKREWEGIGKLKVYLSPPGLAGRDRRTGRMKKIAVGTWIFPLFRLLAACRALREGPLDVFGRSGERRLERRLRDTFLARLRVISADLDQENLGAAVDICESVMQVRGFGSVKVPAAKMLLARLEAGAPIASRE